MLHIMTICLLCKVTTFTDQFCLFLYFIVFSQVKSSLKQNHCYLLWYFTSLNAVDYLYYSGFMTMLVIHSTHSYSHPHYKRGVGKRHFACDLS
jgi:hypothetical protein